MPLEIKLDKDYALYNLYSKKKSHIAQLSLVCGISELSYGISSPSGGSSSAFHLDIRMNPKG